MLIDGVASAATVTCAVNDQILVKSVSTTQFKLSRVKYDGTAQVAASGAMTLLSTVTAADSATVDIETTLNSTYDKYVIILSTVTPASSGSYLYCQFKQSGSYINTNYTGQARRAKKGDTTTTFNNDQLTTGIAVAMDVKERLSFSLSITDPDGATGIKQIEGAGISIYDNGGSPLPQWHQFTGYQSTATAAVTGIRFIFSTGNITSGTFRLYGIANS